MRLRVRDRFPLLVIAGLLVLAALGSFMFKSARRGAFADRLSTFRSEPDGARALYLVLEQQGLPVRRNQHRLDLIDPGAPLVLLGVRFDAEHGDQQRAFDGSDAGVDAEEADADDEEVEDVKARRLASLRAPGIEDDEREKLLEHVRNGATVVYVPAGWRSDPLLQALEVELVRADRQLGVRTLVVAQPTAFTRGVEKVEAKVAAFLTLPSGAVPLLIDDALGEAVAGVVPFGQGRFIVIGAPDLAMNQRLAVADNARFWSSLIGALSAKRLLAPHGDAEGPRSPGTASTDASIDLARDERDPAQTNHLEEAVGASHSARAARAASRGASGDCARDDRHCAQQPVAFDEYHHGFTGERSMGEFAARYGLSYAIAQLLVGVALWALALKRFGRPRSPPSEVRVGSTDALFATSRLYQAGHHHAHAASAITQALAATLATRAGVSGRSTPTEISAALDARGRPALARALLEVARHAAGATTDADLQTVARLAALARTMFDQPQRKQP
jgi:Fe-S cluster assembly scaffold protein SufB